MRVDSYSFFLHFKGNFKGKRYDSAVPPISISQTLLVAVNLPISLTLQS